MRITFELDHADAMALNQCKAELRRASKEFFAIHDNRLMALIIESGLMVMRAKYLRAPSEAYLEWEKKHGSQGPIE